MCILHVDLTWDLTKLFLLRGLRMLLLCVFFSSSTASVHCGSVMAGLICGKSQRRLHGEKKLQITAREFLLAQGRVERCCALRTGWWVTQQDERAKWVSGAVRAHSLISALRTISAKSPSLWKSEVVQVAPFVQYHRE